MQIFEPRAQLTFSALATLPTGKPLLTTQSTASRLKTSGNAGALCSSDTFLPSRKPGIGVHQIGGGSNVNEMPCVDL